MAPHGKNRKASKQVNKSHLRLPLLSIEILLIFHGPAQMQFSPWGLQGQICKTKQNKKPLLGESASEFRRYAVCIF